jgi:hypothetical protein
MVIANCRGFRMAVVSAVPAPIVPERSDGAGGGNNRPMFGHSLMGTRSFHRH